jgi:hypothetical protein
VKVNPLKWFFESKPVQKFYKKACDPKNAGFFNNTLPTLETLASTACYVVATERRKDIPREQKNVLQWQNVLSGVAGMAVGSYMNRKVSKFANDLAPKIDKKICDVHKVEAGLKVGLPLLATALIMRFVMPIVTTQASTMIEDYRRAKKAKLNVTA